MVVLMTRRALRFIPSNAPRPAAAWTHASLCAKVTMLYTAVGPRRFYHRKGRMMNVVTEIQAPLPAAMPDPVLAMDRAQATDPSASIEKLSA